MLTKIAKIAARVSKHMALMTSAALAFSALSTNVQALPFNQISQVYFFGDSLTDSGFSNAFPGLPAGKAPTFTTFGGYTWAQYIARDIKGFTLPVYPGPSPADTITNNTTPTNGPGFVIPILTGVDYACGGSTTNSTTGVGITYAPSLVQQVSHFLATMPQQLDPNAVYFIWSGANDILKLLGGPTPTEIQLLQTAQTAAIVIANQVALLSARGAKRFVVMSLPSLGATPLITSSGNPALIASLKNLSYTFDGMINQQLGKVIKTTGAKVLYVNVYTELDKIISSVQEGKPFVIAGQSFTFVNYLSQACAPAPSSLFCPNNGIHNYVFADSVHPSDRAHRVISLYVETQMQKWAV
jgi:outer membrane lipase/esterase